MKTGLVLEGGGIRGIFSAGVMDVLMEEGIVFDGAIGVSAGAAFGCNYKSRQNRRSIRYNLKFARDPRYSSLRSLLKTGDLFNAQFCYHDIPEKLDPFDMETFRENPMEFYIVCTDVETGKPVYHLCEKDEDEHEMLEWFRASGSMPLVSRVVEVGGYKLLDGGISDSIPLRFMEEQGYDRNLVILTRPADYAKKPNSMMPLIRRVLREYPAVIEGLEKRHLVYNEEVAYVRQRESGKFALVIRPDTDLDVGRVEHDRTKIRAAYKEGRRKARRMLPAIRRFLAGAAKDAGTDSSGTRPSATKSSLIEKSPLIESESVDRVSSTAEEDVKRSVVSPSPADGGVRGTVASPSPADGDVRATLVSPSPAEEESKGSVVKPSLVDDPDFDAAYILSDEEEVPVYVVADEKEAAADRGAEDGSVRTLKSAKKDGGDIRSVLVGEPEEKPEPFRKPFPAGKQLDVPVDPEPFGTSTISKQAPEPPEAPVDSISVQVGSASLDEFESDEFESDEFESAADGSGQKGRAPVLARNKQRWKKRNWKPGELTSLKQKNED